ncbi:MAG TPA: hypothetical protein VGC76_04180 [Pyrinomonadaceae bacterium]
MRQIKSKIHPHYVCSSCEVTFTKYYFSCPFCDKLITANVPYYIAGSLGVFGILLTAILTTISRL